MSPMTFLQGTEIGGYDDYERYLGRGDKEDRPRSATDPDSNRYSPRSRARTKPRVKGFRQSTQLFYTSSENVLSSRGANMPWMNDDTQSERLLGPQPDQLQARPDPHRQTSRTISSGDLQNSGRADFSFQSRRSTDSASLTFGE